MLRRFRDAVADFPEAQIMLAWIQDLYRIDQKATALEERRRLRSTESRAVLEKMRAWMLEQQRPEDHDPRRRRAVHDAEVGSAHRLP